MRDSEFWAAIRKQSIEGCYAHGVAPVAPAFDWAIAEVQHGIATFEEMSAPCCQAHEADLKLAADRQHAQAIFFMVGLAVRIWLAADGKVGHPAPMLRVIE